MSFCKKILEIFQDDAGRVSSTRVLMIIMILLLITDWMWSLVLIGVYVLSWEKMALICSVFSLKFGQKYVETNDYNNFNGYPNDTGSDNSGSEKKTY